MRPYFQGQLDVFCAIYAVINGLSLTHRVRADTARTILHEALLDMASHAQHFKAQLDQTVEYHDLVDQVLNREVARLPLLVRDPFGKTGIIPTENGWDTLVRWLSKPRRAAVLRFVRPLALPGEPLIRHWTTVQSVQDERLVLFDCSREDGAIHEIRRPQFVTSPESLIPGLIYVDPSSIRLLGYNDLG